MAEGKATGFVRVPHSVHRSAYGWIPIPIVRIKNGDGPSVLMQAGNHGDEWEGQIGLGNLIRALEPKDIKGRLVILPSANFPAAMAGQRTSPIDDGNLNRSFPGNPEGTITEQIAHFIEHALLPGFDYSFDFHSGGSSLAYIPSALAPRHDDQARMKKVIGMLKAFGAPVSYLAAAPQGGGRTFTSASFRQGVVVDGHRAGRRRAGDAALAQGGRRTACAACWPISACCRAAVPAPTPTRLTEIGGDDYYVYASDGGLFEPLVELGDEVKAGQPAARIHFHHTPWREPEIAVVQARRPGALQARPGALRARRLPVPSGDGYVSGLS